MTRKKAAPRAASKKPKPKPNIRKCDACHATKLAAAFQPEHSVCRDCENLDSAQREWLSAIRPAKVLLIDIETAPTLG